jgi:hypothetical protein
MLFALFYLVAIAILVLHFTGFLARHNIEWLVLVLAVAMVSSNFAGWAVSSTRVGTAGSRSSRATLRPSAVWVSITVAYFSSARRMVARRAAWLLLPEAKPYWPMAANSGVADRSKAPPASTLLHSSRTLPFTADQVEHEALEVGGLGDVHRRAGGGVGLGGVARAIDAAAEELVEHVVLVGGEDQLGHRQPIMRAMWPAQMLPKLPDGTTKETCWSLLPVAAK